MITSYNFPASSNCSRCSFYDRAVYYGVLGYTEAKDRERDAQGTGANVEGVREVPVVIRTFGEKRRSTMVYPDKPTSHFR